MSLKPPLSSLRRPATPRAICLLAAALLPLGCAMTKLENRPWTLVESPHFEVVSSLDPEATLELAQDLETFRAAVEFVAGVPLDAAPVRTRVYAFDGRGFSRPFALRGEPGYFLPSLEGGVIVLRTGDAWRGDATEALRHDYAHYLLRNHDGLTAPLWYDEGLAQLASTIDVSGGGAEIGRMREDHVRLLRDRAWVSVEHLLETPHLEGRGDRDRQLYEAQAWAFVHSRGADYRDRGKLRRELGQYQGHLDSGVPHGQAVERTFGEPGPVLHKKLGRYVRQERFDSAAVRLESSWRAEDTPPRPLAKDAVLTELGWLSIALDRPEQAERYFTAALGANPRNAQAHAGLGAAATQKGDWAAAEPHYGRALSLAPDDPGTQLEAARFYLAQAERSDDPRSRDQLTGLARQHLVRARELDRTLAGAHASLAAAHLLDGRSPESAQTSLDEASELLPSSLEIELLRARLSLALGRPQTARRLARNVRARTHSSALTASAGELLGEIEAGQTLSGRPTLD